MKTKVWTITITLLLMVILDFSFAGKYVLPRDKWEYALQGININQFPDVKHVKDSVTESDPFKADMQIARELVSLAEMIKFRAGDRIYGANGGLTAIEGALRNAYYAEKSKIDGKYQQLYGKNKNAKKWKEYWDGQYSDDRDKVAVLGKYFPVTDAKKAAKKFMSNKPAHAKNKPISPMAASSRSASTGLAQFLLPIIIVGGIILVIILKRKAKKGIRKIAKKRFPRMNLEALDYFGDNPDNREKKINQIFDSKDKTIHCKYEWNYTTFKIKFDISRNIAAMTSREREMLRIAYLLSNRELLNNDVTFSLIRFGLVYGDSKAGSVIYIV